MSDYKFRPPSDKQTAAVKIPPQALDAEQSVLGGLLLDNSAYDKINDLITANDFYKPSHQIIFAVMTELCRQDTPLDVVTIAEALKQRSKLEEIGGEVTLFELQKNTPSVANIVAYAKIVRERSVLRQLISTAGNIADSAFAAEGRSITDILDEAERLVFGIAQTTTRGNGPISIAQHVTKAVDRIRFLYESGEPISGLSTGYKDLDELTSGLQPGDLIIVAGRPSMGKTAFAVNIAEHAALLSKKPILIFSMEMPGEAIAMRMISSLGRISQQNMRAGKLTDSDWPRISSALNLLSEAKLFVDDTPALSPAELRSRARRIAKQHGQLGLVVIDYLQLMQVPNNKENRTAEISEISRSLKALAKELNVPLIAASQLNRSLESRHDRRPVMSDLRESGAIEQDADLIAFIYRDEVYNENSSHKGTAEIIIAKQRNGPIGKVRLTFMGQYSRFENYASENAMVEQFA